MSRPRARRYATPWGVVELDPEGDGRFVAFVHPTGTLGRLRVGTVLGGGRLWVAELVGRSVPVRAGSCRRLVPAIVQWAERQRGPAALGSGKSRAVQEHKRDDGRA